MSTYHIPGKGIPAVLRKAAGLPQLGGSKAKAIRSLKDVVGLAQVAVKVYRDMLRTPDEPPPLEPPETPPPTEAGRLRQRADIVWLALGLVGRDLVTDTAEAPEALTEEELRRAMREEVGRGILERLDRIIQTLQRWLNLFALFLSRFFFFEYPNNLRHLCTTMPWSIWPALVVLWGVCWMFYGEAESPYESQDIEVPQQFSSIPGYPQPSVSPLALGAPTPPSAMAPAAMQGDPLIWGGAISFTPEAPRAFRCGDSTMLSPAYQPNGQVFGLWPGAPHAMDTTGFDATPVGGVSAAPDLFPVVSSNELMLNPKGTQASGYSTSMSFGTPPTSPGLPTGHGSPVGAEEPGKFKCGRPSCEGRTFDSANDLRRHRARHNRSFVCSTCSYSFGTNTDLRRHRKTVHKEGSAPEWFCTEASCARAKAFSRKDNWAKHMEAHRRKGHAARLPHAPAARGGEKQEDAVREAESGQGAGGEILALRREVEKLQEEKTAIKREMEAERAAGREREAKMWDLITDLQASLRDK